MAVMRVNPTRMELSRIKKRLQVARRGYKLLKDKRDEMMKQFLDMAARNKELRSNLEEQLVRFHKNFLNAQYFIDYEMMQEALMLPKQWAGIKCTMQNIMGVEVPEFSLEYPDLVEMNIHPYGFAFTRCELDASIEFLSGLLPDMVKLAQLENSVQLLAEEIEKTRRRVSALEYVLIPQLEETIKYISMKLDENERGNLTRLMKVKDLMIERSRKDMVKQNNIS